MSVQFLVNGVHPDGTPGLVSATRDEWQKIIEDNLTLPKEQRRHFYRDVISDGDTQDYIFMELPKKIYFELHNQNRKILRNYEAQKEYSLFSYDVLLEEGLEEPAGDESVEDIALSNIFVDNLKNHMRPYSPWASELIDMYIYGNAEHVQKFLMEKCNIGRTTAYRYQLAFEFQIKNFLKKNETK